MSETDSTGVQPQSTQASAAPQPPVVPPKPKTPGSTKFLIGVLVLLLVIGGIAGFLFLARRGNLRDRLAERLAERSGAATQVAPADSAPAEEAPPAEEPAPAQEAPPADPVAAPASEDIDEAALEEIASADATPTDGYRQVMIVHGYNDYESSAIRLPRGTARLTAKINKTTGDPISFWYFTDGDNARNWWSTSSAAVGQAYTVEIPVRVPIGHTLRVDSPPGNDWIVRVEWKR